MKKELHQACLAELQTRIDRIRLAVEEIQAAANEETKSSAGDKFETGRAMMQQEKDKMAHQLAINVSWKNQLNLLNPAETQELVAIGSLVITQEGKYYLSIPLGKLKLAGQTYFAISLASPIGKALLNKKAGDEIVFQQRKISILRIL